MFFYYCEYRDVIVRVKKMNVFTSFTIVVHNKFASLRVRIFIYVNQLPM